MEIRYLNLEYFFYNFILFLKKSYLFLVSLPWPKIISSSKTIATILIVLFIVGIIYNIIKFNQVCKNKPVES